MSVVTNLRYFSINFRFPVFKKFLFQELFLYVKNYQGRGLCYLPKLKAGAGNRNRGLDNSGYYATTEFFRPLTRHPPTRRLLACSLLTRRLLTLRPLTRRPLTRCLLTCPLLTRRLLTRRLLTRRLLTRHPFTRRPFTRRPLTHRLITRRPRILSSLMSECLDTHETNTDEVMLLAMSVMSMTVGMYVSFILFYFILDGSFRSCQENVGNH